MQWVRSVRIRVLCSFIIFSTSFLVILSTSAENPREEYRQLQQELRTHQKKLESVKKTERSVIDELNKTTADLSEIQNQLIKQKGKTRKIQSALSAIEGDIKSYNEKINDQRTLLKKRLRVLSRFHGETDAILVLLSGEDSSQALRIARHMNDISRYDYALINQYKETAKFLTEKQEELSKLFAAFKSEEGKLSGLEDSLQQKKKKRESLLISVRKEKSSYEKMIAELKDSSNRLYKIIQENEKREKELKKKRSITPSPRGEEPQEDSGFARLKGSLPWPVNGNLVLHYGSQVDPLFNLPIFRSGVHIKTAFNSPVRAVHGGKIVFADNFKGYNQLVIINHGGGYHTLYGYLSKIFSKNGAIIKENQIIGEAGESTALGTSGLYFEIRYKGKPLDPQQWLKK